MEKRIMLFLTCLFLSIGLSMAQVRKVTGVVVSSEDNEPIIGASIVVKGTTAGTITDMNGQFVLENLPSSAKTLVISYVGMKTKEVAVAAKVNVALESDSEQLDELVVTAMGISRDKKALGYALQEVKSEQLTAAAPLNAANALQGKVAGVQITAQGGQVGASQSIVIRGNSSFGSNDPLIVVDGVPISNDNGTGAGINLGSGLSDINPEDIESISVLKGGSAALYGMRAGNGVILITTKSGKKDKGVQVSYDGSFTVDQIYNLPKLQNKYGGGYYGSEFDWKEQGLEGEMSYADFAKDYGFTYYDGMGSGVNDDADESWGPRLDIGLMLPQYNSPVVNGVRQATPWISHPNNIKNFFNTGYSQTHNLSLTSATDKVSTRVSLGFRDQKGTTPNTDQKRYTGAFNTKMEVNKYIEFDGSASFTYTHSDNLPVTGYDGSNPLQSLLQWHQRQIDTDDLKANYDQKDEFGNYTHYNWQAAYATNPYWNMYHNTTKYDRDRFIGKASLWIKPTDWLKFEGRLGYDHFDSNQKSVILWSVDYPDGWFRDYDRRTTEINADFVGYFNKKFIDNKFDVNVMAGANYRDYTYALNAQGAAELTVPGIFTVANAKGTPYTYMTHRTRRSNSVYSNVSLGWANQVYLDMSFRNDWDSTIKEDFFYPSFSGSWILTETFPSLQNGNVLNFLKLRGGWAKIGNATDPYMINSYMSVVNASFDGTTLYYNPIQFPPSTLRPEMVKTWEVGFETSMFNNLIHLDAAYYQRNTSDQIMSANVGTATGYRTMLMNAGKINNKGVEVSLTANILRNPKGFNWSSTLNFSKDKSTIVELYKDPTTGQDLKAYTIGSSWSCYNYAKPGKTWGTLVGTGFVRNPDGSVLTEDGFPVYDTGVEIGDVTPDYLLGWSNEFSYKNLSFGFLLDFRKGGDVYSITQAFGLNTGIMDITAKGDMRENGVIAGKNAFEHLVFKNEDGSINNTPVNPEEFFANGYNICEMAVFDGSFLKLREMHLTYTFPQSLLKKSGLVKAANISLIANNLALLWVHKSNILHIDPESTEGSTNTGVGFESNSYPPSRSIGIKLGVTF